VSRRARRYARAVFEIALESDELEGWQADLDKIVQAVAEPEIKAFLESPRVPFDEKKSVLAEELKDCHPLALNLAYLLLSREILDILKEIRDEYQRLLNGHQGIETVEVITAVPLREEEKEKLANQISSVVGKKVVLETREDPVVIGGFKARIGDQLLDGSVAGRLEALRRELTSVEK
jgi:F-type H+-transporting ATPase subunit delta